MRIDGRSAIISQLQPVSYTHLEPLALGEGAATAGAVEREDIPTPSVSRRADGPRDEDGLADADVDALIREAGYAAPSDDELRRMLSADQYRVTRMNATEPPFRNAYDRTFEPGIYRCV